MGPFKSVVIAAFMMSAGAAGAAGADPIFSEDFESGSSRWMSIDEEAIDLASDPTKSCPSKFQRETTPWSGGRVKTAAPIPVSGGGDYCLSMWVRGSAGAAPFAGVETFDANGTFIGDHWLIGTLGFNNGFSAFVVPVQADDAWHWYAAPFKAESTAVSLDVKNELFEEGAPGHADFDDIRLSPGACPRTIPLPPRASAACRAAQSAF